MKGWENNILPFVLSGDKGKCPKCGNKNVDVMELKNEKRQSLSFLCRECGSSDHFDGFAE